MNDNILEISGETVEAAIETGLKQLGLRPSDVLVDVVDEGSPGVFGLGARPARVRLERITRPAAPQEQSVTQISKPYIESTPISFPTPPPPPAPTPAPQRDSSAGRGERRPTDRPQAGPSRRDGGRGQQRTDRPQDNRQGRGNRPERGNRPPRRADADDRSDTVTRAQIMDEELPAYLDVKLDDDENAAVPLLAESVAVAEADYDEEASVGLVVLNELLERMDVRAQIVVRRARPDDKSDLTPWILDIAGDHSSLIGRRGDTLAALQYITRLITSREMQKRSEIIVDVDGYKARRARSLHSLALRMADEATQRNRTVALEPMPPHERRIIHLALRGRADVATRSIGEGPARKVTIVPRSAQGDDSQ